MLIGGLLFFICSVVVIYCAYAHRRLEALDLKGISTDLDQSQSQKATYARLARLGAIGFFLGCIIVIYSSQTSDTSGTTTANAEGHVSSMEDLKQWADREIIADYCERYHRANSFNNETKRQREISRVEESSMTFIPISVKEIVEDNDLSDSYKVELGEYITQKLYECQEGN